MKWSNQDKVDWILEKARINLKKIDVHMSSDDYRAEQMQKDIEQILVEYFDDNWEDTAYSENKIEQEEDREGVIADMIYQDNLERKWGVR